MSVRTEDIVAYTSDGGSGGLFCSLECLGESVVNIKQIVTAQELKDPDEELYFCEACGRVIPQV